ncbi:MAG: hypothetical protein GWN01_17155 [Nitrosopumilaceae archaeon]|nr:hypothetical protein [Nitrosopumilaceae archaeon]NIU89018.1 hypothetical protein [Nitrosopumilaceae archaeon]NIV66189.1 hypothetical protein [Nitrosopumilaceae archaeon]NIX63159.1 hypothetical protein [Nitrosopumilaceae archaeon]
MKQEKLKIWPFVVAAVIYLSILLFGLFGPSPAWSHELADIPKSVTAPMVIQKSEYHQMKAQIKAYKYLHQLLLMRLYTTLENTNDETQKVLLINIIQVLEDWKNFVGD